MTSSMTAAGLLAHERVAACASVSAAAVRLEREAARAVLAFGGDEAVLVPLRELAIFGAAAVRRAQRLNAVLVARDYPRRGAHGVLLPPAGVAP